MMLENTKWMTHTSEKNCRECETEKMVGTYVECEMLNKTNWGEAVLWDDSELPYNGLASKYGLLTKAWAWRWFQTDSAAGKIDL